MTAEYLSEVDGVPGDFNWLLASLRCFLSRRSVRACSTCASTSSWPRVRATSALLSGVLARATVKKIESQYTVLKRIILNRGLYLSLFLLFAI